MSLTDHAIFYDAHQSLPLNRIQILKVHRKLGRQHQKKLNMEITKINTILFSSQRARLNYLSLYMSSVGLTEIQAKIDRIRY